MLNGEGCWHLILIVLSMTLIHWVRANLLLIFYRVGKVIPFRFHLKSVPLRETAEVLLLPPRIILGEYSEPFRMVHLIQLMGT